MDDLNVVLHVMELTEKYGIKSRVENAETVTLARISHCFPIYVLDCIQSNPDKVHNILDVGIMKKHGFNGFSSIMRSSAIFHIIPPNGKYTGLVKVLLYYKYLEVTELNYRSKNHQRKDKRMWTTINFAIRRFKSNLVVDTVKELLLEKYLGHISSDLMNEWSEQFDYQFPVHKKMINNEFGKKTFFSVNDL